MNKEASPNVAPAIIRSAEPSPPQDNVVEVKTTPAAIIGKTTSPPPEHSNINFDILCFKFFI